MIKGHGPIAIRIEERLRARWGWTGEIGITPIQVLKWARRARDPLPIEHFAGGNFARETVLDEWTDRNVGKPAAARGKHVQPAQLDLLTH